MRIFVNLSNDNMTRQIYFIILLFSTALSLSAQVNLQEYRFRIYLKDKGNTANFSTSKPEEFLSKRAIDRKQKEKVEIDASDFPVSQDYLQSIENSGGKILSRSRWFNTCVAQLKDSSQIDLIRRLSFVDSVKYVWRGSSKTKLNDIRPRLEMLPCADDFSTNEYFGLSSKQFGIHHADLMAKAGFQGSGIVIGVIDAGFTNVDVIPYFEKVNMLGQKNFVPDGAIFSSSDHGTKVFSTMAANQPKMMMGSAPQAAYWLLRSEDPQSEFPVEEDYWVEAIEFADSVGVDIVNTSLGYSDFDDRTLNYNYKQINGRSSLMTLAAEKAYEKGMLIVCSAGNEGNKTWKKITVPADAFDVLTIGAMQLNNSIAKFSSLGPTADGRIKPDLVSVGMGAATIGQNGAIGLSNGTSFSSPFMTGLIASLWSINPQLTRSEIIRTVKESADRYHQPDTIFGYGVPDFAKAMKIVLETINPVDHAIANENFSISFSDVHKKSIVLQLIDPNYASDTYSVKILNEMGSIIFTGNFDQSKNLKVPIEANWNKSNHYLYVVLENPFEQFITRLKL
jgi:subtilisin family serine protease